MADQNPIHEAAAKQAARDSAADIARATAQGTKILSDQQARHNHAGTAQRGSFTPPSSKGGKR